MGQIQPGCLEPMGKYSLEGYLNKMVVAAGFGHAAKVL